MLSYLPLSRSLQLSLGKFSSTVLNGLWCTEANITHVSHAGNRSHQQAGLNVIRHMLQKAAVARAVPKALAAKADLLAAEKKVGAAFGYYLSFAPSI